MAEYAAADCNSVEEDGELILLKKRTGDYFGLNETAAAVWNLILEEKPLGVIRTEYCNRFIVDPETAARDVQEIIDRFLELGLVSEAGGETP